ncbi:MAG: hypothetical protein Q4G43_06040 [Mobilicoccus sp.]|nr:hypothetical protein [Mobilicoccus sp.]
MNAVLLAVVVMLALALARVHVVMALVIAAIVGGLVAGMGITGTMESFTEGIAGGASIALSYALLGAFAVAIAHSGLPRAFAGWVVERSRNATAVTVAAGGATAVRAVDDPTGRGETRPTGSGVSAEQDGQEGREGRRHPVRGPVRASPGPCWGCCSR